MGLLLRYGSTEGKMKCSFKKQPYYQLSIFNSQLFLNSNASPPLITYSKATNANTHLITEANVVQNATVDEPWLLRLSSIPMFSRISKMPASRAPLANNLPALEKLPAVFAAI